MTTPEVTTCPTCTRLASAPYRWENPEGEIISGCIDAAHTPHLEGQDTPSAKWHFRPAAVEHRLQVVTRLQKVLGA